MEMNGAFEQIEFNLIAILNRRDGATDGSFGRSVNAHDSVRDPRDATVGEKGHFAV